MRLPAIAGPSLPHGLTAPTALPSIEEGKGPCLDAFPRRRPRRRRRIVERAVRSEARRLARVGVIDLEDERLVPRHLREVVPLVRRVVSDVIDLAGAVLVAPLDPDEALLRNRAAIADRERIDQHLAADRPPDLDDRPALREAALGLGVAHDLAQPARGGGLGAVVVHALHRRTQAGALPLLVDYADGRAAHNEGERRGGSA